MKNIVLITAMLIAIPIYGIKVTITKTANNSAAYTIERSLSKTAKQGAATLLCGKKQRYTLDNYNVTLELNPKDVLQIFAYIQQRPYIGAFTKTSLGKKFSIDESFDGAVISIDNNNRYQILKNNLTDTTVTDQ